MRNQLTCSVLQSSVESRVPLLLCFSPSAVAPFRGQASRSARAELTLCFCVCLCESDQTLSEPCSWLDGVKRGSVGVPRNISRVPDNPVDIPDGAHTNANAGTEHAQMSWLSNKCKKRDKISLYILSPHLSAIDLARKPGQMIISFQHKRFMTVTVTSVGSNAPRWAWEMNNDFDQPL